MKLIEQIRKDRLVAFKAKENIKKDVLGCLISESCKKDKEPDDIHVLSVIKKFIEGAEEVKNVTKDGDYEFFKADKEIDVLKEYRPKQLSEQEIRDYIRQINSAVMEAVGEKTNLGNVMKEFKNHYPNQYDGALVSKIAKEML